MYVFLLFRSRTQTFNSPLFTFIFSLHLALLTPNSLTPNSNSPLFTFTFSLHLATSPPCLSDLTHLIVQFLIERFRHI